MWYNGFIVVIDMALHELNDALCWRYRDALVLGAFREDICYLPLLKRVVQSPSLKHFYRTVPGGLIPFCWPGPRSEADRIFAKSIKRFQQGHTATAFVQLGRILHLLIDMSCPVHAHSVWHGNDSFEWRVEAAKSELESLAVPAVESLTKASQAIERMAKYTRGFEPDRTSLPWGRALKRLGLRRSIQAAIIREQTRQLIPVAAGYAAALYRLFLSQTSATKIFSLPDKTVALRETLAALELPYFAQENWFADLYQFCYKHGGAKYYSDLIELIENCRDQLACREVKNVVAETG
ncbi:MAG: hypothetical protein AB1489_37695 [Acidobacteriota bacterium]